MAHFPVNVAPLLEAIKINLTETIELIEKIQNDTLSLNTKTRATRFLVHKLSKYSSE